MSLLERIVSSGWNFVKKHAAGLTLCSSLLMYNGCSGGGGGGGAVPPVDPNPPDSSFMQGAVSPPDAPENLVQITYTDEESNTYDLDAVEGQAVVLFDANTPEAQASASISNNGGTILSKIPKGGLYLAAVAPGSEMAFIAAMRAEAGVRLAGLNQPITQLQQQYTPQEIGSWSATDQEYLKKIRAFEGWDVIENSLKSKFASSDITLSVIDVDFDNPIDPFTRRIDDITSRAVIKRTVPLFPETHGFDVATFAAATGDNANKPVGINWYSPIRLVTTSYRDWSKWGKRVGFDMLYLLTQEIGEAGADVVNLSIGYADTNNNGTFNTNEDLEFKKSFRYLRSVIDNMSTHYPGKRFLAVLAAGNDNVTMNWTTLRHDNMLVVGACNNSFIKAPYSNNGSLVDIFVPGTDANGRFPVFLSIGSTQYGSGTSFAAPIASGLASIILEAEPNLSGKEVKDRIVQNSLQVAPTFNVLDMYGALSKLSPPPVQSPSWAKTYAGSNDGWALSVEQTSDGGFIFAGRLYDATSNFDPLAIKLASDGSIEWQKKYVLPDDDAFNAIKQTSDGGFIAAGNSSSGGGVSQALLFKLNSDGTINWQKSFGGAGWDEGRSVFQSADGGYVVGGHNYYGAGNGDAGLTKFNSDGTLAWQHSYGNASIDEAFDAKPTSDGGYIIAGYTNGSFGLEDGWVLKLNSDRSIAWQKAFGGGAQDIIYSIEQTIDGGYIAAGRSASFGTDLDGWILKLNSNGTIAWHKTYSTSMQEELRSVQKTSDGSFVAAGYTAPSLLALKLNSDGTIAWQKGYTGGNGSFGYALKQTNDLGYIVAGYKQDLSLAVGAWVLKLNNDGTCPPIDYNASLSAANQPTTATADTANSGVTTGPTVTNTNATVTDTNVNVQQQAP